MAEVRRLHGELGTIEHEVVARNFEVLRSCAANQSPMSLHAGLIGDAQDEPWRTFIHSSPRAIETLRQAVTAKLEIAEGQAHEVETRVREELSDDEFTEHAIAQHPRLARARAEAALWASLLSACDDPKASQGPWKRVTKHLPVA